MNKKKIFFLIIGIIVIIVLISIIFKKKIDKIIKGPDKKIVKKVNIRKDVIKELKVLINLTSPRSIRVKPILNSWIPSGEVTMDYQWYINGEIIDFNQMMLTPEYYKKGDKIYCIITPKKDQKVFNSKKSELIIVKNTPPIIKYDTEAYFDKNGKFVYTVDGFDVDEDELTYSLIDPEPGMSIDKTSGDITWNIEQVKLDDINDEEKSSEESKIDEDRLAEYYFTINFIVKDSEGAETKGSIIFNILTGKTGIEK